MSARRAAERAWAKAAYGRRWQKAINGHGRRTSVMRYGIRAFRAGWEACAADLIAQINAAWPVRERR